MNNSQPDSSENTSTRSTLKLWILYMVFALVTGLLFRSVVRLIFGESDDSNFWFIAPLLSGAIVGAIGVAFLGIAGAQPSTSRPFTHSRRVTGYNMTRIIQAEGKAGNKLVGIGMFRCFFQSTDQQWEYAKVTRGATRTTQKVNDGWELVTCGGVAPLMTSHFVRSSQISHGN